MSFFRKILKLDVSPINYITLAVAFIVIGSLTTISFLKMFSLEEGTLGDNTFDVFLAESFVVWRFPFHTILYIFLDYFPFLGYLYFPLLFLNVLFYSCLIERILTIVLAKITRTKNN